MEKLLHYCWKHRILPFADMRTIDGKVVDVIDPGMLNTDAGPDFFNAKVAIGGKIWAGNVEIHTKRQDWYAHGHNTDAAYDNVILHVIRRGESHREGMEIKTSEGRTVPEMEIDIPEHILKNYRELIAEDSYPPCYRIIPNLPKVMVHAWMAALQTERLEQKTEALMKTLSLLNGDWEHTFFVALARSFGMGANSDALEMWARELPVTAAAHHRDDLFQIEALFFGRAGMLDLSNIRDKRKDVVAEDKYFSRLTTEYSYLLHKFSLQAPMPLTWHLLRMRPQNFPHVRIAQLARLFHERRTSLSSLLECKTPEDIFNLLSCGVSEYWERHYVFGKESLPNTKHLSKASANVIMINCAIPILFAYGRFTGDDSLCDRAIDLLDTLKAENNTITRLWKNVGLDVATAGDSQALIQLKKCYCDRKDCLRCRIGYKYLAKKK